MSEQKPKYATNATPNTPVYCMRCGLPKNIPPYSNTLATKLCTCPPEPAPVKPTPNLTALDLIIIFNTLTESFTITDNGHVFQWDKRARRDVCGRLMKLAASLNVTLAIDDPNTITIPGNDNPIVVMEAQDET
jgi:hypothetical protein